ncbi:MAG: TlpA family protein disulfide reductase [Defluviitaleaceae bacterium]|nr:TlpA family protein disulfide reductase [Defluviitaleaceae bacterium]
MKYIFALIFILAACAVEQDAAVVEEAAIVEEVTIIEESAAKGVFPFEFSALDINGNIVTHDDLPEREFFFVYLWATWCGACVVALPLLGELYEEFNDRVGFLGLLLDLENEGAERLITDAGATFPHIERDANSELATKLNTGFVPSAGLFRADGSLIGGAPLRGTRQYRLVIETALGI